MRNRGYERTPKKEKAGVRRQARKNPSPDHLPGHSRKRERIELIGYSEGHDVGWNRQGKRQLPWLSMYSVTKTTRELVS